MSNLLASRFANAPVMVSDCKADWMSNCLASVSAELKTIEARASSEPVALAYDDFWPAADSWMARYRPYIVQDGTLLIPIKGMLLHDFGYQLYDWATGYVYIQKAFERGMADGSVQRIAMILSSGGGEVAGCFDAVDRVFAMRGEKPIHAFVNEHAYSAAYAWASVADKITITRTGGVGSVGVVTAHMDVSGWNEKIGIKITFIHAGEHKVDGNPHEPLSDVAKNRMQARIDGLYNIFVSTVARNLALDEQVVRDTKALTYSAEEAVSLGFAHEIRAFDEALAAFSGGLSPTAGEETMSTPEQAAALAQADLDAARAEGRKEGATAERERIQGIMGCDEAKTRRALANHLSLNTELSVDSAKGILAASPAEDDKAEGNAGGKGSAFEQAMGQNNPELGADGGGNDEQASQQTLMQEFRAANGIEGK